MTFEIHAEISGNNAKLETRLIGDYTTAELKMLDKLLNYAIIKPTDNETRKKDNWVKGDKGLFAGSVPTFGGGRMRITKSEYTRLCHQIATDYPLLPADGRMHFYENRNCIYQFTVLDFGSYSFSFKAPIEGNEEKIAVLRGSTHE